MEKGLPMGGRNGTCCCAVSAIGAMRRWGVWSLGLAISTFPLAHALWHANWEFDQQDAIFWGPGGAHQFHFALGGLVVSFLAYKWALVLVQAWGDLVKSAFDCYLVALKLSNWGMRYRSWRRTGVSFGRNSINGCCIGSLFRGSGLLQALNRPRHSKGRGRARLRRRYNP